MRERSGTALCRKPPVATDPDRLIAITLDDLPGLRHGDRAAHFVNNMMSQGAVMIDPTGVVRMRAKE